jgi:hypothetical protein
MTDMRARAVIEAVDKTGKTFDSIAGKMKAVDKAAAAMGKAEGMARMARQVDAVASSLDKVSKIDAFRGTHASFVQARTAFREAQANVTRLGAEMAKATAPTAALGREYAKAQREVRATSAAFEAQKAAVLGNKRALESAGVDVARLTAQERKLKIATYQATAALEKRMAMQAGSVPGATTGTRPPASTTTGGRQPVAIGMPGGGVVAGFGAYQAYQKALGFEREINAAEARGELNKEQSEKLRRESRKVGAEGIGFTGQQLAKLGREYVQAGYEEHAAAFIRPTARFAIAGDVDAGKAADFTTSAMASYGIRPKSEEEAVAAAKKYQDIVAKGANVSRLGVEDFASGFKFSAPMAARLGVTMEQLSAMIATMGQSGLAGQEAGVAIRSALVRTVKPTQDSRQVMAELGLKFDDYQTSKQAIVPGDLVNGLNARGIAVPDSIKAKMPEIVAAATAAGGDVGTELTQALIKSLEISGVQDKAKLSSMVAKYVASLGEGLDIEKLLGDLRERGVTAGQTARIFDAKQGTRIGTMLFGDAFEGFVKTIKEGAPGSVDRAADRMTQGAVGSHNRLVGSFDALVLSISESGVLDKVATGLDALATGIRSVSELSPKMLEFATAAAAATAAAGVVGKVAGGGAAIAGAAGATGAAAAAGRVLPSLARAGLPALGVAGYYGATAVSEAAKGVGAVAAGKHYTPMTPEALATIKAQLDGTNGTIAGIESRLHPSRRGEPNPDIDRLRGEAADLTNRLQLGELKATVEGPVTATLEGAITSTISVKVDGGTVTGMSSTSSSPQVKTSVGTSMGHLATR